jgi:hypothetical protein
MVSRCCCAVVSSPGHLPRGRNRCHAGLPDPRQAEPEGSDLHISLFPADLATMKISIFLMIPAKGGNGCPSGHRRTGPHHKVSSDSASWRRNRSRSASSKKMPPRPLPRCITYSVDSARELDARGAGHGREWHRLAAEVKPKERVRKCVRPACSEPHDWRESDPESALCHRNPWSRRANESSVPRLT